MDANIEFVRKNEGYIYGDGSADLLTKIKTALVAVEGPYPKDPRKCAQAIHAVLKKAALEEDMTPDIETFMRVEGDEGRRTYTVSWESGPYQWAIQASFIVMDATGRLCEPYFSFDLCLYDVE